MVEDSFKAFVLDQLSALPDVRARAMFGAHGLYQGDHFFAILDAGRLFFKTNADSQPDYTTRGRQPFTYEARGKMMTLNYHEVPPEILEDARELVVWARKAIQVAAVAPPKAGRLPGRDETGEPGAARKGKRKRKKAVRNGRP
jgi:DNA transformation protein